jgi:hypothetical protein
MLVDSAARPAQAGSAMQLRFQIAAPPGGEAQRARLGERFAVEIRQQCGSTSSSLGNLLQ